MSQALISLELFFACFGSAPPTICRGASRTSRKQSYGDCVGTLGFARWGEGVCGAGTCPNGKLRLLINRC